MRVSRVASLNRQLQGNFAMKYGCSEALTYSRAFGKKLDSVCLLVAIICFANVCSTQGRVQVAGTTISSTVMDPPGAAPLGSAGVLTETSTTSREIRFALEFIW
jgi:hypothetical protein